MRKPVQPADGLKLLGVEVRIGFFDDVLALLFPDDTYGLFVLGLGSNGEDLCDDEATHYIHALSPQAAEQWVRKNLSDAENLGLITHQDAVRLAHEVVKETMDSNEARDRAEYERLKARFETKERT